MKILFQEKYWDSYTEQEKVQEETLNQLEIEINDLKIEEQENNHFWIEIGRASCRERV